MQDRLKTLETAFLDGNIDDIRAAICDILPINTEFGENVLMTAINRENIELIKYLLGLMPKDRIITYADNCGHNAFMYALSGKNEEIIDLLLPYVDGKHRCNCNNSILMMAITKKLSIGIIKKLIPLVDINASNEDGDTALYIAFDKYCLDVIDLLMSTPNIDIYSIYSNEKTLLYSAAKQGHVDLIEKLVNGKMPAKYIDIIDENENTALHVAVRYNRFDCAKILADISNHRTINKAGKDPMHKAIDMKNTKMIDMLWKKTDCFLEYYNYAAFYNQDMADHIANKNNPIRPTNNTDSAADYVMINKVDDSSSVHDDIIKNSIAFSHQLADIHASTRDGVATPSVHINPTPLIRIDIISLLNIYTYNLNVAGMKSITEGIESLDYLKESPLIRLAKLRLYDYNIRDKTFTAIAPFNNDDIDKMIEIFDILITKCNINSKDSDGRTALMNAIMFNNIALAERLILKSDLKIKCNAGAIAYKYANNRGFDTIASAIKTVMDLQ
jgi:ankyrin repeat protein